MNPPDLSIWRTQRLTLSRPTAADLAALCAMEQDSATMASLGGTCPAAETEARLGRLQAHWDAHGFGWWIVRNTHTGQFVGRGGLRWVRLPEGPRVEVGYGFLRAHWNKGFATELAAESIRVGFEVLDLEEIHSFTLPGNGASRRVMEKCGLRYWSEGLWGDRPHVFYKLGRDVWSPGRDDSVGKQKSPDNKMPGY